MGPLNRPYHPRHPPVLHPDLPYYMDAQGRLRHRRLGHTLDHLHSPSHHTPVHPH